MTSDSTWGIPKPVRSILAARVTELRVALTEDARRQLAALGLSAGGISDPPGGRGLSAEETHTREVVLAVIDAGRSAGITYAQSLDGYLDAVAFTLLDRLVAFRCLEQRGLLLVDGQAETLVRTDPARGVPSLVWRVRAEQPGLDARAVVRETYRRGGAAMTERVKLLFDPDDEPSAIFPTLPVWQRALEALNDPAIPTETWATDELMGWVYQYWSSELKDAVYAKLARGGKIEEPSELAAATTLYTERYIVDYLVQNTLGTTWVEMHPDSKLPATWPYYVRPPEGNLPVERQVKRVRELTLIDPCVGSGHFLVRAFELFVQLYAEEGIEDPADVPALILENNLYGADIDRRAVQIAALALYLKGCERAGTDFRPRQLNLVACDIAIPPNPPDDFLVSMDEPEVKELARSLWTGLAGIRTFGSLLHPERAVNETFAKLKARSKGTLWEDDSDWAKKRAHFITGLRQAFSAAAGESDLGQRLFGEEASRGLDGLQILGRRYDVVVTNPPYAGSKNLDGPLKAFIQQHYAPGKRDLYAAFILRCREFAQDAAVVGMVTQQSWMFLSSYHQLREGVLRETSVALVAQLGAGAFEEVGGGIVNTVAFTLATRTPDRSHILLGKRLTAALSASAKAEMLRRPDGWDSAVQVALLDLPMMPLVFWLPAWAAKALAGEARLGLHAAVVEGLHTSDDERFVRYFWEVGDSPRDWRPFAKEGGYRRWTGIDLCVVDWTGNGGHLKTAGHPIVPNAGFYFRSFLGFSRVAQGRFALRHYLPGHIFSSVTQAIVPGSDDAGLNILGLGNSRPWTYLLRCLSPTMDFNKGYVERLPLWRLPERSLPLVAVCLDLTRQELAVECTERSFLSILGEKSGDQVRAASVAKAWRHSGEGLLEDSVQHLIVSGRLQAVIDETGVPAGWNSLLVGYDALPEAPEGIDIPAGLTEFLASLEHRQLAAAALAKLKGRLRSMYEAGPGAKEEVEKPAAKGGDEDEEAGAALGARIPIPTETFLEELSVKLELHPISVHWLLEELRAEGVVSPPLRKAELEEYLDVTLVRMLGYRWPEQDAYEAEHGPILDPDLVDGDGIIPLVPCGDERTAEQRVSDRLVRSFGEDGAEAFVRDVRKYVRRDLGEWIAKDLFKAHTRRFKNRPIAWHLKSPEGAFEALVLYHRLSRETLAKLRVTYAGDRLARLRADQTRARERKDDRVVSDLQLAIEDVEAFRATLEGIERGTELKHRIRCRWKDETEAGRPGPYAPDIDDGVKVNIRPFQESGLLAAKVINKW
jgi:hypothetical protein